MSGASEPGSGQPDEAQSRRAYVRSGLDLLGLEAGPDEIAIIEVVDAIYRPSLQALIAEGFDGIPHEPGADMSRPPRTAEGRYRSLADLFERVDVLTWPTIAAPAPRLDDTSVELPSGVYPADYVNPRQAGIANLAGVPAISVPVGLSPEGLPVAVQLIAPWGRDELLLDLAEALERATDREWVDAASALAAA